MEEQLADRLNDWVEEMLEDDWEADKIAAALEEKAAEMRKAMNEPES